jgi:type I restriction enzyme R subunit
LRGSNARYFVATTVDLLTTGVDVPNVRNVVFFKYVRSPIAFYQMVGRGTRLDYATGKLMFRVYDYTDATRLFGEGFVTRIGTVTDEPTTEGPTERPEPERIIQVDGIDVRVTDAGHLVLAMVDGKALPVTVEEYKARLAAQLVEEAPTIETFRARWVIAEQRAELLRGLQEAGLSAALVRELDEMSDYDLFDVLAELGYGQAPRTRSERAEAFLYKHHDWLEQIPENAAAIVRAFAEQFARAGTEELERPEIFSLPAVRRAGGLAALKLVGRPVDVLRETKERMFAA